MLAKKNKANTNKPYYIYNTLKKNDIYNFFMKKIVFLGSKKIGYQCLQYLIENETLLQAKVIAVSTNPQAILPTAQTATPTPNSIYDLCSQHQITTFDHLKNLPACDFIISVQYHKILKINHILQAKTLAINLHMAPLPEYRGCNQFSFAILDNKTEFGTTLHQLDTGIDSGDIIAQTRFPIPPHCFVHELYQLTEKHSLELFKTHINNILHNKYTLTPQKKLEAQYGTSYHFRHEINDLKNIQLHWDAQKIEKHIRATYFPPFEPPYCYIGTQKIYFVPQNMPNIE